MSTDKRSGAGALWWGLLGVLLLVGGIQPLFTLWAIARTTEDERMAHLVLQEQLAEARMQLGQAREQLDRLEIRVTAVEVAPRADRARRLLDRADAPAEQHTWEGIREDAPGRFTIARSTIDFALDNLAVVSREARLVPSYHDGKHDGFKLFAVRPDSLFHQLGLRNGDVVTSINDLRLGDMEQVMAVYEQFEQGELFRLEVSRRGEPISLVYQVE